MVSHRLDMASHRLDMASHRLDMVSHRLDIASHRLDNQKKWGNPTVEIWHRPEILGTSTPSQKHLGARKPAILTITERIYSQKASTKPYPYAPLVLV